MLFDFSDNGIDNESFLLLDPETIKELISKVWPRMKFLKKYRDYTAKPNAVGE